MTPREETIAATDGVPLAARRFPAHGPAWGHVLVASAMGVRQDFYAPFAQWLASQGLHVTTFDYRGVGASLRGPRSKAHTDVTTWAIRDLESMLAHATQPAPTLPLFHVGHSLGGQLLAIVPGQSRVTAAVHVVAGSGWHGHGIHMRWRLRFFWHVAVPALTRAFGYFPGRAMRMVGDMPGGVALQWRRWCLHRDYLLSEGEAWREAYARSTVPVLSYSFADDELLTRAAIDDLDSRLLVAPVERRHVNPRDIGVARVGHFGYFAQKCRETLWEETLQWLRRKAPT